MIKFPTVRRAPMIGLLTVGIAWAVEPASASVAPADDARVVAALDTEFQAAVKNNDAETIGRHLANDMVLVTGRGKIFTREDHLVSARKRERIYAQQDEVPGTQTVRVWGDTAVVTALLWCKGTADGKPFDYKVWFSDTYVRTPTGWKYVFGQASLPLPPAQK
ncbi:nuclear transport factor 2 family protein [Oleiharenicola lentus]|uniref:nuclear transport factor 2 family protein n=1 Tax=Oleiharenicola lentus TaxID=2508720 RepID=UPI003F671AF7